MKKIFNIIFTAVVLVVISGCSTPAKIVQLDAPDVKVKAEVHIDRDSAFNGGRAFAIFGANEQDYIKIDNGGYRTLDLPAGDYEFFVRSEHGDNPYKLRQRINPGEVLCLNISPNGKNFIKALFPFTYSFGNSFLLNKKDCPEEDIP